LCWMRSSHSLEPGRSAAAADRQMQHPAGRQTQHPAGRQMRHFAARCTPWHASLVLGCDQSRHSSSQMGLEVVNCITPTCLTLLLACSTLVLL
jgi:hypothetical protein